MTSLFGDAIGKGETDPHLLAWIRSQDKLSRYAASHMTYIGRVTAAFNGESFSWVEPWGALAEFHEEKVWSISGRVRVSVCLVRARRASRRSRRWHRRAGVRTSDPFLLTNGWLVVYLWVYPDLDVTYRADRLWRVHFHFPPAVLRVKATGLFSRVVLRSMAGMLKCGKKESAYV
jgi:hypothetical protein